MNNNVFRLLSIEMCCETGEYLFLLWYVCYLHIYSPSIYSMHLAQSVKNPPAIQETLVRFLGQEDLLEKG